MAGGFLQPVSSDELMNVIPTVLEQPLGELDRIKHLPGFRRTVMTTLRKSWAAGLDLHSRAQSADAQIRSRFTELARLESLVLASLPPFMRRPAELVARAIARMKYAERLVGRVEIYGHTELEPVWRPLLQHLSAATEVVWIAGPRYVPDWVAEIGLPISREPATTPTLIAESCASPRHEALEALRWARALLAQGRALPHEIAIATAAPQAWDDHFAAFAESTDFELHFVHGRRVLELGEGQLAAALAELLLRGFSRTRMIRLVDVLGKYIVRFEKIPATWRNALPDGAPLLEAERWRQLGETLEGDHTPLVREIIDALSGGLSNAHEIGERLLAERSLDIWRSALREGPPAALDITLAALRTRDSTAPESAVIWTPASALAATPRPYVRLLGLTSRAWPRRAEEDPLLADHLIPALELDPLPIHQADRRDFGTILATSSQEVVCSRARFDGEGRANGTSSLFPRGVPERHRQRARIPEHAASSSDRLFARPEEFAHTPRARSTDVCWSNWHQSYLTPHDGLLRADHPVLRRAVGRLQSATSLKMLLRDPLGYLWRYGFSWDEPEETEEPLFLDALAFGSLLHAVLEHAVTTLETRNPGGFATALLSEIVSALDRACSVVAEVWEMSRPIPPPILWKRTLAEIRELSLAALTLEEEPLPDQRSWAEIPFGRENRRASMGEPLRMDFPWDPARTVLIPGTDIRICGVIDRLDLSQNGSVARVTDYKSGKAPKIAPVVKGGCELQRCLYAYAVKTFLPDIEVTQARLLYPRMIQSGENGMFDLPNPPEVLERLTEFFYEAKNLLIEGNALLGADSGIDFALALPSGLEEWYRPLKAEAMIGRQRSLPQVWEMD
jgi:hypothetical protein